LQLGRLATFTDLMALFVEHGVPLQESLPLAAKVSGDKVMLAECTQLADAITAGQSTTIEVGRRTAIPNLIRWQFASLALFRFGHERRRTRSIASSIITSLSISGRSVGGSVRCSPAGLLHIMHRWNGDSDLRLGRDGTLVWAVETTFVLIAI
ncbi:hypothetical protein ACFL2H_13910, partial [Planctomycetota bacterium]